ncbi:phosphate ABC transporter permease PstA [Sporosarcina gallistercoris]|uniref:Phosphate transport system permease protein PstA n=1 Tax=Sporosarcina gallistercoris TaxID=2762245 RepID=A0ABR8PH31_9BACL|nr:phosphate ABC transporter permease PstA [Sporosarcina gallistercoris]MBD7907478.1 phosphate ABC transporter permease PstA [Sporosarcina gallistercoris]
MLHTRQPSSPSRVRFRLLADRSAKVLFGAAALFGIVIMGILLVRITSEGISWLSLDFLTGRFSTTPEKAGIMGAVLGTFWLLAVVVPVTMIVGIGSAVYLELYSKNGKAKTFIQTNIANLAGVPSIVYGILGLTVFVRALGFGSVVLAGGLTLSLLILPIVIVAAQEALRSVPSQLGDASYALGGTKWQTIQSVILPVALPSILTGAILALSRAIGETAPLVVLGIPALLIPFPGGILDRFTVLPMQIYYWTLDAALVADYAHLAAAASIVLLISLFLLNGSAIYLRNKYSMKA